MPMKADSGRNNSKHPPGKPGDDFFVPAPPRRGSSIIFMSFVALILVAFSIVVIKNQNLSRSTGASATPGKPAAGSAVATSTQTAVVGLPMITEVMTGNKGTVTDGQGNYVDWIELYNPTDKTINLMGFFLSDRMKNPTKCVLPQYLLKPGSFVIVYADSGTSTATELHASFKLSASGTQLLLVDPNGTQVQSIEVPQMDADCSYAMDALDASRWAVTGQCTPGLANTPDGYAAFLKSRRAEAPVEIDEVMAGNTMTIQDEDGNYSDWVELYNPTDKDVDLTGCGLSNKESEPKRWTFPQTKIGPGKFVVIFLSGKGRAVAGQELHTNFKLNAFKDVILLSNIRGQIVSEVQINDMKDDASLGLVPGTDKWMLFRQPTPGFPNSMEGWNELQPSLYPDTVEPIVMNEVMSNNASTLKDQFNEYPDWIELYNRSAKTVNLKNWGLPINPASPAGGGSRTSQ